MWHPQSIRAHLAAVFLLFFALVVILGSFSIWRLSNFNLLSADVAEIWLPTTRALGDLNKHLVGSWLGTRHLLDGNSAVAHIDSCLHQ